MRHSYDLMTGEAYTRTLDANGHEQLSPEPHERAQTSVRPETIAEKIRRMVQSELLARAASDQDFETFVEADDFDVGDDYDPTSPYEEDFDPPLPSPSPDPVVKPAAPAAPPEAASGLDVPPSK